jgi:hypothetical protein
MIHLIIIYNICCTIAIPAEAKWNMHFTAHFGSIAVVIALSVCVYYNSIENDFAFDGKT